MARESPGQTLQATALVHDAFVRLVHNNQDVQWNSRGHFFGAAAEAMRRILIERARKKKSTRGGGDFERVPLDGLSIAVDDDTDQTTDLLELDDALLALERIDPVKAQVVKLRFFAGLSIEDTARAMDISPATAKRYWNYARSWLYGKINGQ
jgi:RNA polymerase sigma factor (TIGR02999 family)